MKNKKKLILIIPVFFLALSFFLWLKGNTMREIRTEIVIEAPAKKVWGILTDFQNWDDWNPIINQANGVASLGTTISITMRDEDGKDGPKYAPIITIFREPKSFRWRAKMMSEFLFTNDKVFELETTATGTRLIHKELFRGMLVPLFWGKLSHHVPSMLKLMNEALKLRVEKSSN